MDPRRIPTYSTVEAAQYLHLHKSTLTNWVRGHKTFKSIIETPNKNSSLSFINLVEAHVLWAITRKHKVPLRKVRKAILYLQKTFNEPHPLAMIKIETDQVDLLIREMGQIINANREGQIAMKEIVEASLRRVERAPDGSPIVLYPFVADDPYIDRRPVMFNPTVSFGRLVIVNTGIPTAEVARRYKAGESMDDLASDYDLPRDKVEDAIRCELQLTVA